MLQLLAEFILVTGLMLIGSWLEGVNGKHGFLDEMLAPLPLGLGGLWLVFIERL